MLVQLLFIFILSMPALGLVFIGLALASSYRRLIWLSPLGGLVFALSFYSLHLKNDAFFYSFFILGPFFFGLGLPLNLTRSKRIQAGFSGLGIIVVFFLALVIMAQMLNHF